MAKRKPRFRILNIFSKSDDYDRNAISLSKDSFPVGNDLQTLPKLNFKIFTANGGYILEFYKYDYLKDQSKTRMYVITDTENLTDSIASICQQEFLQL